MAKNADKLKSKKKKGKKLTKKAKELMISKHPKTRKGLYYGTDGIMWDPVRKIWYDATVHSTKT